MAPTPDPADSAVPDPREAARAARLRYVTDRQPGYSRKLEDGHFVFFDQHGARITDEAELARIRKLAIPPAYRDVWICRHANGHLQAVGRDARGRKQYRYHPRWRLVRDEAKYDRMLEFGRALPAIRARVAHDMARPGLPREKVLATIVHLLERTLARVGNAEYARSNKSFGLTTLRNRHAAIARGHVVLDFRGKHGLQAHFDLPDRRLVRIISRLRDLPGQALFQYLDEDGACHAVGSDDVNEYLHAITGLDITAKDFRTWAATHLAAQALRDIDAANTAAAARKNVLRAIEAVAAMLGNTPAVCRKCYIHPAILDGYLDGSLAAALDACAQAAPSGPAAGLTALEEAVTAFLGRRPGETPARAAE